jgi:hypothetical protein
LKERIRHRIALNAILESLATRQLKGLALIVFTILIQNQELLLVHFVQMAQFLIIMGPFFRIVLLAVLESMLIQTDLRDLASIVVFSLILRLDGLHVVSALKENTQLMRVLRISLLV